MNHNELIEQFTSLLNVAKNQDTPLVITLSVEEGEVVMTNSHDILDQASSI